MSGNEFAGILTGTSADPARADLHAALDLLLDDAAQRGGALDAPAFWGFVASLAAGRGIADEIEAAAVAMVAAHDAPAAPEALWPRMQWAMLFHLLKRLTAFNVGPVPEGFSALAFSALAANMESPKPGIHPDVFGLATTRGGEGPLRRAARHQLVLAVYFRAERDRQSLIVARNAMLPLISTETWKFWQREVAEAKGRPTRQIGAEARAAARGERDAAIYDLDAAAIDELWRLGWLPS